MATYMHWSVSLWWDPDDVPHCRILSPGKTKWWLISATLCGWRHCFVADQLWLLTRIQKVEEESALCVQWSKAETMCNKIHSAHSTLHLQLSFSLHSYLLYLLLNSCNENGTTPVTWSSASLTHGKQQKKHLTKWPQQSCWSIEKVAVCMHEGEKTKLWTSAKIKPALFEGTSFFPEPPTVYRGKSVMFCIISSAVI